MFIDNGEITLIKNLFLSLNKNARDLLDTFHRQILKEYNINLVEIRGNWEQRFEKAVIIIKEMIEKKQKKYQS